MPPNWQVHGEPAVVPTRVADDASTTERMRAKVKSPAGAALCRSRKAIGEPVFGLIKSVWGLRRFLLRGLENVGNEFRLMALTHNLLKLHRCVGVLALGAGA